jgi:hypothetical protein
MPSPKIHRYNIFPKGCGQAPVHEHVVNLLGEARSEAARHESPLLD